MFILKCLFRPAVGACAMAGLLSAGCQPAPPQADAGQSMALAIGLSQPISFQTIGEPTDIAGDDASRTRALPLAEAIKQGLRHDPNVQAALARVRVALAEARQARLLPNPVLNVAFRFPEGGGQAILDAGLSADLLTLLRQPGQRSAADHRLRAAAAEAIIVALDQAISVQEAYTEAQALDAQVAILTSQRDLNQRLLDLAKVRLEAGEAGQLDVLTLDAQRVEMETAAIERRADARDQRLVLARLIGRPSHDGDWSLDALPTPPAESFDERAWLKTAMERRPEIQAKRWELAALGDEVALAQWNVFEGSEIGADAERDGPWSVGPAVAVPLGVFDWGQARKAKAEAQRIEARHDATATRRQVVEDVRRALARLTASQEAVRKVETELVPLQQQRYAQAEAAYQAGAADVTALYQAEQDLQAARSRLVEVQKDAVLARARLHRAVGGAGVAATLSSSTTQPSTRPATVPATPSASSH